MMHHKGMPGHHDMMFKDLNLTDAQKAAGSRHHEKPTPEHETSVP